MFRQLQTATVRWLATFVLSALLAACGGGGGGADEDLTATISYGQGAYLWRMTLIQPTTTGLKGNSPRCSLSRGPLPAGLSLASNCSITGTPTEFGSFSITVTMTVPGFTGSISTSPTLNVYGPPLLWPETFNGRFMVSGSYTLEAGNANTIVLPHWEPAAGETVAYTLLSGSLPPGLTMNAATGTISGAPTTAGVYPVSVRATATGNGRTASGEASFSLVVEDPVLSISYVDGYPRVGQPFTLSPSLYAPVESFDNATFAYSMRTATGVLSTLPAGLTLNPTTGVISGTATTADAAGSKFYGIALDVTRNGVTFRLPTSVRLSVQ